jgi:hypothetical protein
MSASPRASWSPGGAYSTMSALSHRDMGPFGGHLGGMMYVAGPAHHHADGLTDRRDEPPHDKGMAQICGMRQCKGPVKQSQRRAVD